MNITLEMLQELFFWMSIINFGLLIFYSIVIVMFQDLIYKVHSKYFKMKKEKMSSILYKVLAFYKIATIAFNLVPYIALRIIS